jgi:polyhydroxyalkanoate synthesis repressor PhaR
MSPVFCSAGAPVTEPRLIRKYANRRLYDSTDSRHVTLEDIRKLVASGINVKVIDDKSGEELTRAVLLQIIAEQEQFGQPVLSIQLLEGIIRFYGNPVQEMLSRYLEQSLGNVLRQQQTLQAEIAKTMGTPLTPLTELTRQNMEMWARMQASMLSAMTPSTPAANSPSPDATGQPSKKKDSGNP